MLKSFIFLYEMRKEARQEEYYEGDSKKNEGCLNLASQLKFPFLVMMKILFEKFCQRGFGDEDRAINADMRKSSRAGKFIEFVSTYATHRAGLLDSQFLFSEEIHEYKSSIGIPVNLEIRSATLAPKVLLPLKKYERYASEIPIFFEKSLRDNLFFFI